MNHQEINDLEAQVQELYERVQDPEGWKQRQAEAEDLARYRQEARELEARVGPKPEFTSRYGVGSNEWYEDRQKWMQAIAAWHAKAQDAPPAFDPTAAQRQTDAIAEELDQLYKNPSENYSRIQELEKQLNSGIAALNQHDQAQRAAQQAPFREELATLDSDLERLYQKQSSLMLNPTENWNEMQETQKLIAQREARQAAIQNGEADALQWKQG